MSSHVERDLADRSRADAQDEKMLAMLIAAGYVGCTNLELWTVGHAANSRISDLRRRGYEIVAKREGAGVWRYALIPPATHQPSRSEQRRREELEREAPLFTSAGVR